MANDPRLAQLSPDDRKYVLNEVSYSKSYCTTNQILPQAYDCDCFARSVFDYRLSRPIQRSQATTSDLANHRAARPEPLVNFVAKLDCRKCVAEERVTRWVSTEMRKGMANGWTAAKAESMTQCVSRKLIADLRTQPAMGDPVRDRYNPAYQACNK